jgi:hypothetical protein
LFSAPSLVSPFLSNVMAGWQTSSTRSRSQVQCAEACTVKAVHYECHCQHCQLKVMWPLCLE